MIFRILLVLIFCSQLIWVKGQSITEENWNTHPDILLIGKQYQQIQSDITSGLIKNKSITHPYDQPYVSTDESWWIDQDNQVRVYKKVGGSGDSILVRNFYYDENGQLFFVFITGGAVNGSSLEHRIYTKNGKRIWEMMQLTSGPGWGWPQIWPDDDIEWRPRKIPSN